MQAKLQGIRKAAILVASLDQTSADRLLDQMDSRQAQRVRQAVMELDDIDPAEQRQILEEFVRLGPPEAPRQTPGVELGAGLARRLASGDVRPGTASMAWSEEDRRPFRALQRAEDDKLARVLLAERPQTVALVLAHLAPEQAGAVLARFTPALQVEVIRRLVELEETDPEIVHDVERALESRLSEQVPMQRRRVAGLAAVTAILEASGQRVGMQILDTLAIHDQSLADRLGPERLDFADLIAMDDRRLRAVLDEAEPEEIILALVGAPSTIEERILRLLPSSEAEEIRRQLSHPGPTRLSDVEEAKQRLAEIASRQALARRFASGHHSRHSPQGLERIRAEV